MYQSTQLPNLCVLPTSDLRPHEECDPRRVEKLSKRILEEGILKNPPIVTGIPNLDRFVILDGANRSLAFLHAGVPHIVAQLVSYSDPGVIVDTWYHVVSGMDLFEFEKRLSEIQGIHTEDCMLEKARQLLASEKIIAYIVCESGVRAVTSKAGFANPDMRMLRELVNTYAGRADIHRASNDIWEIQKPFYPKITALMIFPRLHPADIIDAANNGERVPSGITRHIIPARALNINIPIGILMADWQLERKREWLNEWLMGRMAANAIRFYAESTFSFNE
jgi:hypothetical protein